MMFCGGTSSLPFGSQNRTPPSLPSAYCVRRLALKYIKRGLDPPQILDKLRRHAGFRNSEMYACRDFFNEIIEEECRYLLNGLSIWKNIESILFLNERYCLAIALDSNWFRKIRRQPDQYKFLLLDNFRNKSIEFDFIDIDGNTKPVKNPYCLHLINDEQFIFVEREGCFFNLCQIDMENKKCVCTDRAQADFGKMKIVRDSEDQQRFAIRTINVNYKNTFWFGLADEHGKFVIDLENKYGFIQQVCGYRLCGQEFFTLAEQGFGVSYGKFYLQTPYSVTQFETLFEVQNNSSFDLADTYLLCQEWLNDICYICMRNCDNYGPIICYRFDMECRNLTNVKIKFTHLAAALHLNEDETLTLCTKNKDESRYVAYRFLTRRPDKLVNLAFFTIRHHFLVVNKQKKLVKKKLPNQFQAFGALPFNLLK
ncbi:hypothetical protein M3Y97_00934400 [Aphelenchoides bicaudatus]|nr:hypothetical protein M3Y97_00934400 [Aphelenchoides bicaudatus]